MSKQELDPIECHIMGMSVDKVINLDDFKRHDASGGVDTPSPAGQIPDFVLKRAVNIVPIDTTQVE